MRKSFQAVLIIMALSMIFGNASTALAQQVAIAGGYGEISTTDHEVVTAANFAVRAKSRAPRASVTLLSIERAEVQVVAGLNYRLHLRVAVGGKSQDVTAVVYKNLRRKYALSSWEANDNGAINNASASSRPTIQQLVKSVADAFAGKTLGSLDAERPYLGSVRIVIEHSLGEYENERDRFESKTFKTLEQAEQWLRSRETEGGPARNSGTLRRCSKGVCTFEQAGMLHNNLYLKKINYGLRSGRPYIKAIHLLDGD